MRLSPSPYFARRSGFHSESTYSVFAHTSRRPALQTSRKAAKRKDAPYHSRGSHHTYEAGLVARLLLRDISVPAYNFGTFLGIAPHDRRSEAPYIQHRYCGAVIAPVIVGFWGHWQRRQ